MKAIHEVQQKSGFKNLLLEKKLTALADTLEKKVSGALALKQRGYNPFSVSMLLTVCNNAMFSGGAAQ